ncbi:Diacylglycerol O-acyltransferase 2 [Chamberlinius hualienensis]
MLSKEQRQTLAIFAAIRLLSLACVLHVAIPVIVIYLRCYKIIAVYLVWVVYSTYRIYHGGIRSQWLRKIGWLPYAADFLPLQLIRTTPLDPNKNYVMGSHPHGILGIGAFYNFNTDITDFDKKFPGITPHVISLDSLFTLPILRDALICFGNCASSKKSLEYILKKKGKGNLVILLVGGMDEVAESKLNAMTILLKKRKGFVKLAITTGADLLPSITFGEDEVFDKRCSERFLFSWMKNVENVLLKYFGIRMKIKAIFNVTLNALFVNVPPRIPVATIVGKPIEVVQDSSPNDETINYYHNKYMESIEQLFNEYKAKFGDRYKDLKLEII